MTLFTYTVCLLFRIVCHNSKFVDIVTNSSWPNADAYILLTFIREVTFFDKLTGNVDGKLGWGYRGSTCNPDNWRGWRSQIATYFFNDMSTASVSSKRFYNWSSVNRIVDYYYSMR